MIVKLQRPLESTEKNPPALAYDQNRTFRIFVPMTKELRDLFGERPKIYCEAVRQGDTLLIGKIVPSRGW